MKLFDALLFLKQKHAPLDENFGYAMWATRMQNAWPRKKKHKSSNINSDELYSHAIVNSYTYAKFLGHKKIDMMGLHVIY